MPFIATSYNHRCKGMCKKLLVGIESVKCIYIYIIWTYLPTIECDYKQVFPLQALCYLNVQYLVIPSVSERIGSWIDKYGFESLDPTMEKQIMCHNTLMFHESIRLQKSLVPSRLLESDRKCKRGNKSDLFKNNFTLVKFWHFCTPSFAQIHLPGKRRLEMIISEIVWVSERKIQSWIRNSEKSFEKNK